MSYKKRGRRGGGRKREKGRVRVRERKNRRKAYLSSIWYLRNILDLNSHASQAACLAEESWGSKNLESTKLLACMRINSNRSIKLHSQNKQVRKSFAISFADYINVLVMYSSRYSITTAEVFLHLLKPQNLLDFFPWLNFSALSFSSLWEMLSFTGLEFFTCV